MCGIAGVVAGPGKRIDPGALRAASCSLRHRGPDDHGFLVWSPGESVRRGRDDDFGTGRVGLAHRRLSILDLSVLGWQPMSSADDRYHIVYNGEIYNYVELRDELERLGQRFTSRSDTEVMLKAIAEWGLESAVRRFEGMFAFALLDTAASTLSLVRDPFGIKPLYYAQADGSFVFGSEIKAVLALTRQDRRANPHALLLYLAEGVCDHGQETAFSDVRQLVPAEIIVIDARGAPRIVDQRTYWELRCDQVLDVTEQEAHSLVRGAFVASVNRHLRSDVPVGAALSGGIDSSAIVASIRRLAPPGLELHAFSYFADDPQLSEERWIRAAAEAARATVHEVRLDPGQLLRDVDALIVSQDEPFGGTSIYAQYSIFRSASEAGVRVMLDGQGADEIFGGYASFLGPQVASLIANHRPLAAAQLTWASLGRADVRGSAIARYVAAAALPRWFKQMLSKRVRTGTLPPWIDRAWFEERGVVAGASARDAGCDLHAQLVRSVQTGLLALLRYEDRNSMAFSVESRVPFLTPKFAELVLSLPSDYLIAPDGTRKAALRGAMRGIVPDEILNRRDKIGFQTPEAILVGGAEGWAARLLSSDAAYRIRGIHASAIRRATLELGANVTPPAVPLWRWLNLIRWADLLDVDFG